MYGKVFRQMYKGSMSMAGWEAVVTLQQLIVLADRHGVIDMTPQAISGETTIPLEIIQKGLEILSRPDPESRTPDEDGRRIVLLSPSRSWGWQLVNYEKYRAMRDEEERREYQRQYWHKRKDSTRLNSTQSNSTHADADAEADAEVEKKKKLRTPAASLSPITEVIKQIFPRRAGSQPWRKADKAIRARVAAGEQEAEMIEGARRYADFCRATGKIGTEFVMQASTFFGPDRRYLEAWDRPASKADVRLAGNLDAAAEFMRRTENAIQ